MFECRVPKPPNPIERDLDIELVHSFLTTQYHDPNVEDSLSEDACEGSPFDFLDVWDMNNEKSHESSARTEIEGFLKVPRVKSTVDPLLWWSTNRFQAILHHVVLNKFVIVGN